MADRREQRKLELEEKRRKLKEMREKNKATRTTSASTRTAKTAAAAANTDKSSKKLDSLSGISSVDDLLSSIETDLPAKAAQKGDDGIEVAQDQEQQGSSDSVDGGQTQQGSKEKWVEEKLQGIDTSSGVFQMSIAPKRREMYMKGTMTEAGTDPLPKEEEKVDMEAPAEEIKKEGKEEGDDKENDTKENKKEEKELSEVEKDGILHSEDYVHFLSRAAKAVERSLFVCKQYDVMVDFGEKGHNGSGGSVKDALSLRHELFDARWSRGRSVTWVDWSREQPEIFLSAYSSNESSSSDADGVVCVWHAQNMLDRPEYTFNCQSPVTTAIFPEHHPTLVVAGTYSGEIVMWDMRVGRNTPVQHSPLSNAGHTHPLYCLALAGTRNAHNLVSLSTDGRMCAWSVNDLQKPVEVLELTNKHSKAVTATAPVAATCIGFPDGDVGHLFVGSEDGSVYGADRHGSKSGVTDRFEEHYGPVTGLSFHSAKGDVNLSDLFLSCSTDWSVKLWSHKHPERSLYSFEDSDDYIYDVRWSPVHPSLFVCVDGTGSVSLWNPVVDSEVPLVKEKISAHALNRVCWSPDGKQIVVGDSVGKLFLYDVGSEVSQPPSDSWSAMYEQTQGWMDAAEQREGKGVGE